MVGSVKGSADGISGIYSYSKQNGGVVSCGWEGSTHADDSANAREFFRGPMKHSKGNSQLPAAVGADAKGGTNLRTTEMVLGRLGSGFLKKGFRSGADNQTTSRQRPASGSERKRENRSKREIRRRNRIKAEIDAFLRGDVGQVRRSNTSSEEKLLTKTIKFVSKKNPNVKTLVECASDLKKYTLQLEFLLLAAEKDDVTQDQGWCDEARKMFGWAKMPEHFNPRDEAERILRCAIEPYFNSDLGQAILVHFLAKESSKVSGKEMVGEELQSWVWKGLDGDAGADIKDRLLEKLKKCSCAELVKYCYEIEQGSAEEGLFLKELFFEMELERRLSFGKGFGWLVMGFEEMSPSIRVSPGSADQINPILARSLGGISKRIKAARERLKEEWKARGKDEVFEEAVERFEEISRQHGSGEFKIKTLGDAFRVNEILWQVNDVLKKRERAPAWDLVDMVGIREGWDEKTCSAEMSGANKDDLEKRRGWPLSDTQKIRLCKKIDVVRGMADVSQSFDQPRLDIDKWFCNALRHLESSAQLDFFLVTVEMMENGGLLVEMCRDFKNVGARGLDAILATYRKQYVDGPAEAPRSFGDWRRERAKTEFG